MTTQDVVVEPMTERFLLWRCLHCGPLSATSIDHWENAEHLPWDCYRKRNLPLLEKLTRTYGACAIIARVEDQVVSLLRFYPKAVWDMKGAGELCLQQDFPSGPAEDFAQAELPPPAEIADKTLIVHCLMTGSPQQKANPYQRRGIGTRMARTLIEWAGANGWEHIEARAFEDLPIVYEITGSAGHSFWEKLGFRMVARHPHPALQERNEFVLTLEEQAKSVGIPPDRARDELVMRIDLA